LITAYLKTLTQLTNKLNTKIMNTKHTAGEWVMENPENRKANFVIYTTEKPEGILNVYPGEEAEANATKH
jgi:hypothetical protein